MTYINSSITAAAEVPETRSEHFCKHCRLSVPPTRSTSDFCCAGCEAVHSFINSSGLGQYYIFKKDAPGKRRRELMDSYRFMDDPVFLQRYVRSITKAQSRITFFLDGIHCAACIWLLERLPQLSKAISAARVDFGRNLVHVNFKTEGISVSEIARILHAIGYPPSPCEADGLREKEQQHNRIFLLRMGVAAACAMNIMMLSVSLYEGAVSGIEPMYRGLLMWGCLILSLPPMLFSAVPFYENAWNGLQRGILHIDLPIAAAIVLAFLASCVNTFIGRDQIYFDSIASLIFLLLVGRWLQRRSVQKALDASDLIASFTPRWARRIVAGKTEEIFVESLKPGDAIEIPANAIIPADARLVDGHTHLDLSVLTGESLPVEARRDDILFAGTTNVGAPVVAIVQRLGRETRLGQIMAQVEAQSSARPAIEMFLDRVSRRFVALLLVASIVTGLAWFSSGATQALDATVALLVVSCPCVLALATPLTFSMALSRAARSGMLIKSGEAIERLTAVKVIALDKTRTLTSGGLSVQTFTCLSSEDDKLSALTALALLEQNQSHPLARCLREFALQQLPSAPTCPPSTVKNIAGCGVQAIIDGESWYIGSPRWIASLLGSAALDAHYAASLAQITRAAQTPVVIAQDRPLCVIGVSDSLRPESATVVKQMQNRGFTLAILSGDSQAVVTKAAHDLGIPVELAMGELSPEQKAAKVQELKRIGPVLMVGDGVNDTAALSLADVGLGVHGSAEACLKVADVYSRQAGLQCVVECLEGAQRTLHIVKRNLIFSGFYNLLGSTLAVTGMLGPLGAAVLMPISSLSVVLHARLGRSY
ncbi:MAG: heavy metal translocating P-type ATPase [Oligoflexia bacterium]|nr:heavy metal translocating P-type ATPase [Oligoflexia bacterium]